MGYLRFPLTMRSSATPPYIASMSALQVRQAAGSYLPANGLVSMFSVTPSEWQSQGTTGLAAVVTAWNGGPKVNGPKLYAHGGGHGDTANNGVYEFDWMGIDRPNGWTSPLVISSVASIANSARYSDGKPVAVHTYDGIVYATHNNTIYRFGGSPWSAGNFTAMCDKFNTITGVWSALPNYPGSGTLACSCVYDPVTRKIMVTNDSTTDCRFFNCDTETWSSAKTLSGYVGTGFYQTMAWDSSRGRAVSFGSGNIRIFNINFVTETITTTTATASGATAAVSAAAPLFMYDPVLDCFWSLGGGGGASWSTLYRINAGTFAITANTLTGTPITADTNQQGAYGRYNFMSSFRAFGLISSTTQAPYVVRLPTT